mmetsp:Transcript_49517/g.82435  ORF Transcript_49517/g.82435 Transcript_49517/m.82435 type:complete len:206 (-) Transcript_49517:581-1198(-)
MTITQIMRNLRTFENECSKRIQNGRYIFIACAPFIIFMSDWITKQQNELRDIVRLTQYKLESRHIFIVFNPTRERRQRVQRERMPRFCHIDIKLTHVVFLHLEQRLFVRIIGKLTHGLHQKIHRLVTLVGNQLFEHWNRAILGGFSSRLRRMRIVHTRHIPQDTHHTSLNVLIGRLEERHHRAHGLRFNQRTNAITIHRERHKRF